MPKWAEQSYFRLGFDFLSRSVLLGSNWGLFRERFLVAKGRQNRGLWGAAVKLTAECSTIELPGNRYGIQLIYNAARVKRQS
jgi:hypothetical protein